MLTFSLSEIFPRNFIFWAPQPPSTSTGAAGPPVPQRGVNVFALRDAVVFASLQLKNLRLPSPSAVTLRKPLPAVYPGVTQRVLLVD